MLEIARFWASIASFSTETGKYHIEDVMGPDEFHESLPGSGREGLKDNSYTNIMTVWLLEKALDITRTMDEAALSALMAKLSLGFDELQEWEKISSNMTVLIDEKGIIEQFDGYMSLKELDWDAYRAKYPNIHRMDRILKAEGDTPDNYKVAKQPDVLMAFYTLSAEEIAGLLERTGHPVPSPEVLVRENYAYYEPRTSHGSTLSKVVHGIISSCMHDGHDTAWKWFTEALRSDIADTQGGTTQEGIHCGVMAGTLDTVTRYFAGVSFTDGKLSLSPNLPKQWTSLSLQVQFRGALYRITISEEGTSVLLMEGDLEEATVIICGKENLLKKGIASSAC